MGKSPEAFQTFFESSPEIPEIMAEVGVTSEPVVTVTVRGALLAFSAMETFAVRLVALATVTLFTVTAVPAKLTWLAPWTKCVN